ncbi:MAG: HEAT repeat domain-containing protein [Acidobacteriota bacterium]|nr:HEAT repeat domain-containing protein [Acidobacteriota bacterium]
MRTGEKYWRGLCFATVILGITGPISAAEVGPGAYAAHRAVVIEAEISLLQDQAVRKSLTPLQLEIEKQRMRLGSAEVEERRAAVTLLGAMHHPEASRLAVSALKDSSAIVRATAAASILSLPVEESAANLIPLLNDKDEFVRREAAFALGKTRSPTAVSFLIERLLNDKKDEVRGAAAVALGQIKAAAAVSPLASVLNRQDGLTSSKRKQKRKKPQDAFLLRAAARSLGQIGSNAGLAVLIAVLQDEKAEDDVRRESASALGVIGDPSALPALREALTARDPYLSEAADKAIRNILRSKTRSGN